MNHTAKNLKTSKLHFLLGTWKGTGKGYFPTIDSFEYIEELVFEIDQKHDAIHYRQRTWLTNDQSPSHWESGFITPDEKDEQVFLISNAQVNGRHELLRGIFEESEAEKVLHFHSVLLQHDPRMITSERRFHIVGDQMSYIMKMATQKTPNHQQHLEAELSKVIA